MLNFTATTEPQPSVVDRITEELNENGLAVLPDLFSAEQLAAMRRAFAVQLKRLRWNNYDGYEKTEPYRHMVEDVLTLDQGFIDAALHPVVKDVLNRYLGTSYELVEAKGWKSLPTARDFHGWHGDAWYDQERIDAIPREVKLAVYLTDVKSGAFTYIQGSHRKQHPQMIRSTELPAVPASQILELLGSAGTAFLFDTSGIHRQGVPMLEERQAIFLNYHDPGVRLQKEDIDHYRYHPLLLNAAFLGGLSAEDQRILGFGNKSNYIPAFDEPRKPPFLHTLFSRAHDVNLAVDKLTERVMARIRRLSN